MNPGFGSELRERLAPPDPNATLVRSWRKGGVIYSSREIKDFVNSFLDPSSSRSLTAPLTPASRDLLVDSCSVSLLWMYYSTYAHVLHALSPFPFLLSPSPDSPCLVTMYVPYPLSLTSRCTLVSCHGHFGSESIYRSFLSTPSISGIIFRPCAGSGTHIEADSSVIGFI